MAEKDAQPAAWAVALVEWIFPPCKLEHMTGGLGLTKLSTGPYLLRALEWFCFVIVEHFPQAFRLGLFVAQAAAFALSFAAAPFNQGFFIALAAGLGGMAFRDAYIYPLRRSAVNEGYDTLNGLVVLFAVELFEMAFAPDHALPREVLFPGLLQAFLTITMVRVIMRPRPTPTEAKKPLGTASFMVTRFITCLWIGAALAGPILSPTLTPQFTPHQNGLLFGLSIIALTMAFYVEKNGISGNKTGVFTTVMQNHAAQEAARKIDQLAAPSNLPGPAALEVLAFVFYCLPPAIALLIWAAGRVPSAQMDWLLLGTRTVSCLSLSALWLAVRKANQNMAHKLEQEIPTVEPVR